MLRKTPWQKRRKQDGPLLFICYGYLLRLINHIQQNQYDQFGVLGQRRSVDLYPGVFRLFMARLEELNPRPECPIFQFLAPHKHAVSSFSYPSADHDETGLERAIGGDSQSALAHIDCIGKNVDHFQFSKRDEGYGEFPRLFERPAHMLSRVYHDPSSTLHAFRVKNI
jgi:hypothetical protein